jgi:hypothetical protein
MSSLTSLYGTGFSSFSMFIPNLTIQFQKMMNTKIQFFFYSNGFLQLNLCPSLFQFKMQFTFVVTFFFLSILVTNRLSLE